MHTVGGIATALVFTLAPIAQANHEVEFTGPTDFPVGPVPSAIATGDFNGDQDPDLAITTDGDDDVAVLLGGAGGAFGAPTDFGVGAVPTSVAVGDLNVDNDPDLVVGNFLDNDVSVFLGAAGGTFMGPTDFPTAAEGCPEGVAVANLNPDIGIKPDVVTYGDCDTAMVQARVSILEGDGTGALGAPMGIAAGGPLEAQGIAVGEFNGDVDPELVAINNTGLLLPATGGLGFGVGTSFGSGGGQSAAVTDYDGDGIDDVAYSHGAANPAIQVFRGNGVGGLLGGSTIPMAQGGNLATGDFNGDGDPDLVQPQGVGEVAVLTGVGGASDSFNGPTLFGAGSQPVAAAVADFNGDGKPDIAVANSQSNDVSVLLAPSPAVAPPSQPDTTTTPAPAATPKTCTKKKKKKRTAAASKKCKKKKKK
jgi:hypothetical protein